VISDDPTQFLLESFLAVPASSTTVRTCGPERPLQVTQVMDVTLCVDLVRGDGVLVIKKIRHAVWGDFAGYQSLGAEDGVRKIGG